MFFVPDADLDRLLTEDAGHGDLTTTALGIAETPGTMHFAARHPMVVCATEEAARLLQRLGLVVTLLAASGTVATPGTPLLQADGRGDALLLGWKVAQTLVEWASGIASAVRDIAMAAARPGLVVACTRKTVPFTRALSIKAVHVGGGTMHRTGLGDTVLVFPEHRSFLPDQDEAELVAKVREMAPERKLTVEVGDVATALRMARAGVDVLQLEKFAPARVAEVASGLKELQRRPVLAVAGGVTAANAATYAEAGAQVLVTSAPYTAPPRDVQVRIRHQMSSRGVCSR